MTRYLFFSGKGGGGKTTMAAATAIHHAQSGEKTLIATTDPAAHLGEVFGVPVGSEPARIAENLSAVMIDQQQACHNAFFRNRRRMQLKYLKEIDGKFGLPVLRFPMFQEEIKGLARLREAGRALSGLDDGLHEECS